MLKNIDASINLILINDILFRFISFYFNDAGFKIAILINSIFCTILKDIS